MTIKYIDLDFLRTLSLKEVYLSDQNNDTIAFIPTIRIALGGFSLKEKKLKIRSVELENPLVKLVKLDSAHWNFSFLREQFSKKDTTKSDWIIHPGRLKITNGRFFMQNNSDSTAKTYNIQAINLSSGIEILAKDSTNFEISKLSFTGNDGLILNKLFGSATVSSKAVVMKEIFAQFPQSIINLTSLSLSSDSLLSKVRSIEKLKFTIDLNEVRITPSDFRFFNAKLNGLDEALRLTGKTKGTVNDIKFSDFNLTYSDLLDFSFDGNLVGMPVMKNVFYHFNFSNLQIKADKFPSLYNKLAAKPITNDKIFNTLGELRYTGKLTGFTDQIVSYGKLISKLGNIGSDVSINISKKGEASFSGTLSTENVRLGQLLNNDKVGKLNMKISTHGQYNSVDKELTFDANGQVSEIEFMDYTYKNVDINGYFEDEMFSGNLNISDPNIDLNFAGDIDFTNTLPLYDFKANLHHVNFSNLNLWKKFPEGILNASVSTYISGNSIDNLTGNIKIERLNYNNNNGKFNLDSLSLWLNPNGLIPGIKLLSSVGEIRLSGPYNFKAMAQTIPANLFQHIPSVKQKYTIDPKLGQNAFTLYANIKPLENIAKVLEIKSFNTAPVEVRANVFDAEKRYEMLLKSDGLSFGKGDVQNLDLMFNSREKTGGKLDIRAKNLRLGTRELKNITLINDIASDVLYSKIVWSNSNQDFGGNISMNTTIALDEEKNNMVYNVKLNSSKIMLGDSLWQIEPATLILQKKRYEVNSLKMSHDNLFLNIDGVVSGLAEDTMRVKLNGVELEYLSTMAGLKNPKLQGKLSGNIGMSSVLQSPKLNIDLIYNDAYVNNVFYGDFYIHSNYDNTRKIVDVSLKNQKGNVVPLDVTGIYSPEADSVHLNMKLDKLKIDFLKPYLDGVVQNIRGLASGKMKLIGSLKKPQFDGAVFMQNAFVDIDLLGTTYNLTDSIELKPHQIKFKNMHIFDKDGNKGQFSGYINHDVFKNMVFDLKLSVDNFNVLNTSKPDKLPLFGNVFASGILNITNPNQKATLDIKMKTMPNSSLSIPISDKTKASDNSFVIFTSATKAGSAVNKITDPISARQLSKGVLVNLSVEATPDATAELIFDEKMGDIIRGNGTGNINVIFDSEETDVKMYGTYTVTKGDYLFTLQRIMTKKFEVEEGSTIKWSGGLLTAQMDINAYYRTRASLYDLLGETYGNANANRRTDVLAKMKLNGNLLSPAITFDIELPSMDDGTRQSVRNVINSDEEMNRQIVFLLMRNQFYTPDYIRGNNTQASAINQSKTTALSTASELLSSQLSNWLGQISNDFNLGVNYRPSDELSNQEVDVMLSTQILDDRLSFNTNVGYRSNKATANENIIGDFDVTYKVKNTPGLMFKAYSRSNENILYETSPTTQGLGIMYKKDFNSFSDLFKAMREKLKRQKPNSPNKTDTTNTSAITNKN